MSWNPDKYLTAWNFATLHHGDQKYGKRDPYLNHIGAVVGEVAWAVSCSPELNADLAIQAAVLHDVVEDTKVGYYTLLDTFGLQVARGVLALSKDPHVSKQQFKQMHDCLKRIKYEPVEITVVKLADRIVNLQSLPAHWDIAKCRAYLEESKLIFRSLGQSHKLLGDRLKLKIDQYENLIVEKLWVINQGTEVTHV
jgi:(p)ppGpp synthase/HD superfamily hydrolase